MDTDSHPLAPALRRLAEVAHSDDIEVKEGALIPLEELLRPMRAWEVAARLDPGLMMDVADIVSAYLDGRSTEEEVLHALIDRLHRAGWFTGLGVRPRAPLTVAAALMLPEVRGGARWIEWERDDREFRARFSAGVFQTRGRFARSTLGRLTAPLWSEWCYAPVYVPDLDSECRLVEPIREEG